MVRTLTIKIGLALVTFASLGTKSITDSSIIKDKDTSIVNQKNRIADLNKKIQEFNCPDCICPDCETPHPTEIIKWKIKTIEVEKQSIVKTIGNYYVENDSLVLPTDHGLVKAHLQIPKKTTIGSKTIDKDTVN